MVGGCVPWATSAQCAQPVHAASLKQCALHSVCSWGLGGPPLSGPSWLTGWLSGLVIVGGVFAAVITLWFHCLLELVLG